MSYEFILKINALSVKDVKTKTQILDALSFDVDKNSCLGIFGPSGSGKTTLLNTLMRVYLSSLEISGTITYYNESRAEIILTNNKRNDLSKSETKTFVYIPQNVVESFDPIEKMGKQFEETFIESGFSEEERLEKIDTLLKKMNLPKSILTKYPFQLSGGTLQRCAIGLAIEGQPQIIIADEPTHALDAVNKRRIIELFKDLKKKDKTTVLISTHDISILDYLTDKVLVLEGGRISELIKTNPSDLNDTTYLGKVRLKKKKIRDVFWRMKNEKMD